MIWEKKKEYDTHVRLPGTCYVLNPHLSPLLLQAWMLVPESK